MEKIELPPQPIEPLPEAPAPRIGFVRRLLAILKFVLGILLLVYVYSFSIEFLRRFYALDYVLKGYFWWGIAVFVAAYLFIYEPAIIYKKGQKLLEIIFRFFAPLVRVAPYLLPIYSILLFFLYLLVSVFVRSGELPAYFLFFFGFSLAMHLVFGAKSLKSRKADFLKANYIFSFSLIYCINLWLTALILSLVFDKFSFVTYSYNTFHLAGRIFNALFTQLFVTGS